MSDNKHSPRRSTSDKILHAATTLFMSKGYYGTSMNEIAKLAEVNQSLIHHHFENKEKLWMTVKDELLNSYLGYFEEFFVVVGTQNDFFARLEKLLTARFNFLGGHLDIVKMMEWQSASAHDNSAFQPFATDNQSNQRIQKLLQLSLKDVYSAKNNDKFDGDFHPAFLVIATLLLTTGWYHSSTQWMLSLMCGDDPNFDRKALTRQFLQFIKQLLIDNLKK